MLNSQDWIDCGITLLRTRGHHMIKAEILSRELKVSKGSFYHHFENVDDYVNQVLDYWELIATHNILAEAEKESDPIQRLRTLQTRVFENSYFIEVALRAWSTYNAVVAAKLAHVENIRVSYMAEQYEAAGYPKENARSLAQIEHTYFIGAIGTLDYTDPRDVYKRFVDFERIMVNMVKPNLLKPDPMPVQKKEE